MPDQSCQRKADQSSQETSLGLLMLDWYEKQTGLNDDGLAGNLGYGGGA